MLRRVLNSRWVVTVSVLLLTAWMSFAQDGTYVGYSPYSVYGIGNMHQPGTAWNRAMGGVGVAARNNRFINILNPASVTARDTLSFMADFGLSGRISLYTKDAKKSLNTTFDIDDFVISFPMWNHTAFMVGLMPLSDVGYKVSYTNMDYYTTQQTFTSIGKGGLYQLFAGAGVTLWNRLSLGAQVNYRFGNITKTASWQADDSSFLYFTYGDSLQVNSVTAKLGLQYEQPLGTGSSLTLGATYMFGTGITGQGNFYTEQGSYKRTRTTGSLSGVNMGDELVVGLSYRKSDMLMVEFDYSRSNWNKSGFENTRGFSNVGENIAFTSGVGQSFRLGGEYTPNRNDIRYFMKRCTYRAGVYYDQSYYLVGNEHVDAVGITLGMTLPVFRWYNGISIGLELGQRGLQSSQIKERYFGFNLGVNIFDIWFQKPKYE